MEIISLTAFRDNYIWMLRNEHFAAAFDPGDAGPVLEYLAGTHLELTAILLTHHHPDHIGGVADILRHHRAPVFGPAAESIAEVTQPLREADIVDLSELGAALRVIEVPGHTRGHIAYYGASALFCGDTLFGCGCGRLFEGTPEQMWTSLAKLATLPSETRVYCAHEYTLANIAFAQSVEPENPDLLERAADCTERRRQGRPTVPSALALELATNPFLRCAEPAVVRAAETQRGARLVSPVEVFAALRKWKDGF